MGSVFQLLHSLIIEEPFDLCLEILGDVLVVSVLLETVVFCVQHSVNVILVVCRGTLGVHLLVVVEEVRIDAAEEPLLLGDRLLNKDESRASNPVDKSARRPRVCERKVEKLENLKERPESVHEPVLVVLGDTSLQC